jgi:hypothetical protein
LEDFAAVLAEEEFMKETIPDPGLNLPRASRGPTIPPAQPRNPVQQQQQQLPQPPPPMQHQLVQLQQQLQRVDLDEGIE